MESTIAAMQFPQKRTVKPTSQTSFQGPLALSDQLQAAMQKSQKQEVALLGD